ncbi:hypothetical protein GGX14DRAFT_595622, partial [Mycena pura]
RCLTVPEILSTVFLNFQTTEPRNAGHKALATLARTCTVFQNPALALLWRTQRSMFNIIRCMPPDLLHVDTSTPLPTVRLLRPVTASDWDRALLYAPLVRELSSRGGDLSLASIFLALNLYMPTNCLFPNLITLGWYKSTDLQYIGLLLAPRLEHIFIACPSPDINLSFVAALPRRCPLLQTLHISRQHVPDAICGFLDSLPHLTRLGLCVADMRSLICIGRLPRLRCLSLQLPRSFAIPATLPENLFLNLEDISLYATDSQTATRLVPVLVHAKLKSIKLRLPISQTTQTTSMVNDLLQSVVDRSEISLSSFYLYHPGAFTPAQSALCAITTDSLHLLCQLRTLTEVEITSHAFSLEDCCLLKIARSWTRIRKLELITSLPNKKPVTTLSGLLTLARHCRDLETLALSLDTSSISQTGTASDVVPQTCLIQPVCK